MITKKTDSPIKVKRKKRISPQKTQFKGELTGINEAMRIALEDYVIHQKKNKVKVTYVDLANQAGISKTYAYSIKYGDKDVSTQVIIQILRHIPGVKPYFFHAYDSVKKKYGYEGGLLDGIIDDHESENAIPSETDTHLALEQLQQKLIEAQSKIKEQCVIIQTKNDFIQQLLDKLHS